MANLVTAGDTNLVTAGDTIEFIPDSGWNWSGWNGQAALDAADHGTHINDKNLANESDVPPLHAQLRGRSYTAGIFDSTPGKVISAQVIPDSTSLSQVADCDGAKSLLKTTKGTFRLQCSPARNKKGEPDLALVKTGRWQVVRTGQEVAGAV